MGRISGTSGAGKLTYTLDSLHPHTDLSVFNIDPISGQLVAAHILDYENSTVYYIEIRALHATSIRHTQRMAVLVEIRIGDTNDNAPYWPHNILHIEISERAALGRKVHNLSASDPDEGLNGELRYVLISERPPTGSFAVESLTGALTLTRFLDREECSEITVVLKAEDQALPWERRAATLTIRVVVLDENDNDPAFLAPAITIVPIASNIFSG